MYVVVICTRRQHLQRLDEHHPDHVDRCFLRHVHQAPTLTIPQMITPLHPMCTVASRGASRAVPWCHYKQACQFHQKVTPGTSTHMSLHFDDRTITWTPSITPTTHLGKEALPKSRPSPSRLMRERSGIHRPLQVDRVADCRFHLGPERCQREYGKLIRAPLYHRGSWKGEVLNAASKRLTACLEQQWELA